MIKYFLCKFGMICVKSTIIIGTINFLPLKWFFFVLFLVVVVNLYLYFSFLYLKNITLETFINRIINKVILYILFLSSIVYINWLLSGLFLDHFSLWNFSLFFVFYGFDDWFILSSWGDYTGGSQYFQSYGSQHNPQQGPNPSNSGVSGSLDSNNNTNQNEGKELPLETEYHKLGSNLIGRIRKITDVRMELEKVNPTVRQPYSVCFRDLGLSKNSREGELILKFADDYAEYANKDKTVLRFCRTIKNNFDLTTIFNTTGPTNPHNNSVIGSKVLDALTNHNPK